VRARLRLTGKLLVAQALKHLSIRVPWHDARWRATICDAPSDNSACVALKNIAKFKKDGALGFESRDGRGRGFWFDRFPQAFDGICRRLGGAYSHLRRCAIGAGGGSGQCPR